MSALPPLASFPRDMPPGVVATIDAVNWELLGRRAMDMRGACHSFELGDFEYGGYNVIRFIKFDDGVTWVARVPQLRRAGYLRTEQDLAVLEEQMSSEAATLLYVRTHTDIPVPTIYYCTSDRNGMGIGSPFSLQNMIQGVTLQSVWDEMSEEDRSFVLRQIVHIYLELSQKCRFPLIGTLRSSSTGGLERVDVGPIWSIGSLLEPLHVSQHWTDLHRDDSCQCQIRICGDVACQGPFRSSLDFMTTHCTAKLKSLRGRTFGEPGNGLLYAEMWLSRSFLPHLFEEDLDAKGFPLLPADFHPRNIMVDVHGAGGHTITGVLDWDCSSTVPTRSFAQFPLFIVDHPLWPSDHLLRQKVAVDQEQFLNHLRVAEAELEPCMHLSAAFAKSREYYLFEQSLEDGPIAQVLGEEFWRVWLGNTDPFTVCRTLLDGGLFTEVTRMFNEDADVLTKIKSRVEVRHPDMSKEHLLRLIAGCEDLAPERLYLEAI